jgi:hypothetical protein
MASGIRNVLRRDRGAESLRDLANFLHEGDLPDGAFAGATAIAIDSETMGLRLGRDPLCVVQLSSGDGDAHVVRLDRSTYDAPNLKRLLTDPAVVKLFTSAASISPCSCCIWVS